MVALGIICLALVISIGVWKFLPSVEARDGIKTYDKPVTITVSTSEDNTDKDYDGLRDWEEVLWSTDSNNSDTDGDGSTDGSEVKEGRDPTIAGPDDQLDRPNAEIKTTSNTSYNSYVVDNSLTDKLSKDLFGVYIQARQNNGDVLSQDQIQQVAESIKSGLPKNPSAYYSTSAVTTFSDSDTASGQVFGQKFGRKYLDALTAISKTSGNDSASIGRVYQTLSRDLSILPVPDSLHSTYIQFINNLYSMGNALIILNTSDNDPIGAMVALRTYKSTSENQAPLFTSISNYFKRNAIIFNDPEVTVLWQNF